MGRIWILYLNHVSEISGAEKSLLDLLSILDKKKYFPILACPSGQLAEATKKLGVKWQRMRLGRIKNTINPFRLIAYYWQLKTALQDIYDKIEYEKIRIVHCNSLTSMLVGGKLAKNWKIPLIWHIRDWPRNKWYWRFILRQANSNIAISEALTEQLPIKARVTTIHNGVREEKTDSEVNRMKNKVKYQIKKNETVIGIFGQIVPWKGHLDFIHIAAKVLKCNQSCKFLIVGDDLFHEHENYIGELKQLVQKYGIEKYITFVGYVTDVSELMQVTDIVVSCSRNEPFGRTLVEGMLKSKAVVAYRSGAHAEVLGSNNEGGQLIELGDQTAFARVLTELINDIDKRKVLGRKARKRAITLFSPYVFKNKLENHYQQVMLNDFRESTK